MKEASLERVRLLYSMKRYQEAFQELTDYIASHPENADSYCLLALVQWQRKQTQPAKDACRIALRLAPAWSYPHYINALIQFWSKKYDSAEQSIAEAIRLDAQEGSYYALASQIFVKQHDRDSALLMIYQGLEHDPFDEDCLLRLGLLLEQLGRIVEAEAAYRKLLTTYPEHALGQGSLGQLLVKQKRYEEAKPLLENALHGNPEWEEIQADWQESLVAENRVYCWLIAVRKGAFGKKGWITFVAMLILIMIVLGFIFDSRHFPIIAIFSPPLALMLFSISKLVFLMLANIVSDVSSLWMTFGPGQRRGTGWKSLSRKDKLELLQMLIVACIIAVFVIGFTIAFKIAVRLGY